MPLMASHGISEASGELASAVEQRLCRLSCDNNRVRQGNEPKGATMRYQVEERSILVDLLIAIAMVLALFATFQLMYP